MKRSPTAAVDVAVVGGGPVGSLCALAHSREGKRVALLEGNLKASTRLAGEWLHPPALRILQDFGIALESSPLSSPGKGFVVFPDDGSESVLLPYQTGTIGIACDHATLVAKLHNAVENESNIEFLHNARVRSVDDGCLTYAIAGEVQQLYTHQIVGADGRSSVVRRSLGLLQQRTSCSRMIGLVAEGVELPHEGYGHVVLGGPGPIMMFNLGERRVRIIADVPLDHWATQDRVEMLTQSYARLIPEPVQTAFVEALRAGDFQAANNELRARVTYGTSSRVLIGDAAGHYHPLTAVGLTLGFGDAVALAETADFDEFALKRKKAVRAPEMLALGLYEVFADQRAEITALRNVTYRHWRSNASFRERTMALLACEVTSVPRLAFAFFGLAWRAVGKSIPGNFDGRAWRRARDIVRSLAIRTTYFLRAQHSLHNPKASLRDRHEVAHDQWAHALPTSMQTAQNDTAEVRSARTEKLQSEDASEGLRRAAQRLVELQNLAGGWEGEMIWCPMLTAQYVLMHYIMGLELEPDRRRLVLKQFECTRLNDGVWGLHEHSQPYLFVTTLVYVAARVLGVDSNDALIARAGQFLRAEGVLNIPSWGKFWLAMLNLSKWEGLNPVLPELWVLPSQIPLHPSNWYCHTRLIYMAMASIYSTRFQVAVTPLIENLREELYPVGFDDIEFERGRNLLRREDLFAAPTVCLRIGYFLTRIYERFHRKELRSNCVNSLLERIRWELASSQYTSISPVSGFLNILALWLHDPSSEACQQAMEKAEDWIWEDEENGTRVTGARSASWDTGFALQALATSTGVEEVPNALERGAEFLASQQIRVTFDGFRDAYRNDPKGGWCFAGVWHGWPVTDCTAEAVLGLLAAAPNSVESAVLEEAIEFMLRGQGRDGGFGSYESQRSRIGLEWLNPAEMFGESMTEHSFVECTASCLAALKACQRHYPSAIGLKVAKSMVRADNWLRRTQASDGSWRGVWGVQYIYGTLFGVRGLLAAGAQPGDPAIRLACRWLLARQRDDGGWGEHHSGCMSGRYVQHTESQVIHTAWALIALLEAGDSDWGSISRGAKFLLESQNEDGAWPKQDMAGVFFRTALLDYVLYRQYFPLHALGLYEKRRRERRTGGSKFESGAVADEGSKKRRVASSDAVPDV